MLFYMSELYMCVFLAIAVVFFGHKLYNSFKEQGIYLHCIHLFKIRRILHKFVSFVMKFIFFLQKLYVYLKICNSIPMFDF